MRQRSTNDKLKGSHQAGSKSRKPEDTNLGEINEPKTLTSDREKTSPRNELANTAPNPPETSIGRIASGNLASPPRSNKPPKFTKKDGGATEYDASSLHQTFGTSDDDLVPKLFSQVAAAMPNWHAEDTGSSDDQLLAALHGIGPRDTLEGLLAVQIVAGHNLAMAYLARATPEQPDMAVDLNLNRSMKLMRLLPAQIEALHHHRDKGANKMVVEEVHVHDRGRAIVGPVSHQSSGVLADEDEEDDDDGKSNR